MIVGFGSLVLDILFVCGFVFWFLLTVVCVIIMEGVLFLRCEFAYVKCCLVCLELAATFVPLFACWVGL